MPFFVPISNPISVYNLCGLDLIDGILCGFTASTHAIGLSIFANDQIFTSDECFTVFFRFF